MMNKSRAIPVIVTLIICLTSILSVTGCSKREKIEDAILGTVTLISYWSETYVAPGSSSYLSVFCEPEKNRPTKPVYVWTVSFNGNFIKEIVHDSEPLKENEEDNLYNKYPEEYYSTYTWPNLDSIVYEHSDKGTYTVEVGLYDYDEYKKDKNKAMQYSSFTHTVYCDEVKVSIEATPTKNSREFILKAMADKPKFLPNQFYTTKWEFTNEATGSADTGKTEQITRQYALCESGVEEVEHRFQNAGKYKVLFTVTSKFGKILASNEIIVDVTGSFQIIVPPGTLNTGEEYTFTARTESPEDLPDNVYYTWDFGDGPVLEIPLSNEVVHIFNKPGPYAIHVGVFEPGDAVDLPIGSAITTVEVEAAADHLAEIHQMKRFALDFSVTETVGSSTHTYSWDFNSYGEVMWDGVNFSMEWSQYGHSERMTGRVSKDGSVIEQLKIRHEYIASGGENQWSEMEIAGLPFWEDTMPDRFIVDISAEKVGDYVVYFNTYQSPAYRWDGEARLYVRFTKE